MTGRAAVRQRIAAAAVLLLFAASCATVPKPVPPAAPSPEKPPIPMTTPPPPPPPPTSGWVDLPIIEGGWTYDSGAGTARFVADGGDELVRLSCDKGKGVVRILTPRDGGRKTDVLTTSGTDIVEQGFLGAEIRADAPVLDRIAFSRGRFALRGQILQVLPVQAEIGRVIEDCRSRN